MDFVLKIDNRACIELTNKLEKLTRSALPVAIRGTLNSAAFNVKQVTMPVSADKHFEKRKPNFFKANSKVVMARGFDVNTMKSTVGFVSTGLSYNHFAVNELEQQEEGGIIHDRSFIPLDTSRVGGSNARAVRPGNRLSQINKIIVASEAKGSRRKEKFIKSAVHAGVGGFVRAGIKKEILYRITSLTRVDGKMVVGKQKLYSFDKGRNVDVEGTGFMREATINSAKRLEEFYHKEAERQFQKIKK